jgi:hypothetical protein
MPMHPSILSTDEWIVGTQSVKTWEALELNSSKQ